ncbi:MAG: hypothetical protein HW400_694 [Candidatus Levybacteria bacterium]|nr:hypothetical protein [Candidatus Levybacteria bacterium]
MTTEQEPNKSLSFIHSFKRYFYLNEKKNDRLQLILKHGIISPKNAEQNMIPYELRTKGIHIVSYPGYDELIFLFAIGQRPGNLAIPGDTALFFDNSLRVYESQGLRIPSLSIGEVYVKDYISAKQIKRIRIAQEDSIEEIKKMISKYIPDTKDIEITKL